MDNFNNFDRIVETKNFAQKADIMRYEILYKYGGVYVDTDFQCFRSIDVLLQDLQCFVCNGDWDAEDAMSIGIFGAVPNHPVFKTACDDVKYSKLNTQWINQETGPFFFYRCLKKNPGSYTEIASRLFYPH